jgi:2-C-methyl-D-erythritol 4-phosphate cytidylyltransferase
MLAWSLEALSALENLDRVIVALPAGAPAPEGATRVDGGATRSESVLRALEAAAGGDPNEAVLVHDAARPLVSAQLARRVLAALAQDPGADAAIAAVPVSDTVKRVPGGSREHGGVVSETLDRASLWAVQTPQVFRRRALERALDVSPEVLAEATDDAWLIELAGGKVIVVPSSAENLKVTTPLDLELAETLLGRRTGQGPARTA